MFDGIRAGMAGDRAQIAASALKTAELLPQATLKLYEGAPHGLVGAYETEFNADLLEWIRTR